MPRAQDALERPTYSAPHSPFVQSPGAACARRVLEAAGIAGGTMPGVIGNDLPFVAFVGAGASVIPPSSLPTWNGFNNLVLETLLEVLNEYSAGRQPTAEMLATFRERRDKTMFFAPD